MQYDAQTPQAYLDLLADDWRRDTLQELRAIIADCGPELVEGIAYKMLSYADEQGALFGLNAQKHYVSFYVGDAGKIDPDGRLLQGLNVGKGCIRFTKLTAVSKTNIREFIARAINMRRRGEDTGC